MRWKHIDIDFYVGVTLLYFLDFLRKPLCVLVDASFRVYSVQYFPLKWSEVDVWRCFKKESVLSTPTFMLWIILLFFNLCNNDIQIQVSLQFLKPISNFVAAQ